MLATELGCRLAAVAFTGDDLPDREAMSKAGLAVAVANARPEIHAIAHWSTRARGGCGAVREVCDLLRIANTPARGAGGADGVRA